MMAAGLKNIDKSLDIAADVRVRIDKRIAHTRLRRQIDNDIEFRSREQLVDLVTLSYIQADEPKPLNLF
jgi:hypothetical protein